MPLPRRSQRHRDELGTRARQQAAIAAFGQRALAGVGLAELLEEAVDVSMRELRTDYVAILELTGDRAGLLVRTARGLPDTDTGSTTLAAGPGALARTGATAVRLAPFGLLLLGLGAVLRLVGRRRLSL